MAWRNLGQKKKSIGHQIVEHMKMSKFFSKLASRALWANLLGMAAVVLLLLLGVKYGIDVYTHHGESIKIPDVRHKSFTEAEKILTSLGFEVQVSDTGYVKALPPDCILEQLPEAGKSIKSGRIIYLTVNSSSTPTLSLPDVIDNGSLREVTARLRALGFKVGPPRYVPGEKDWVYGVIVNGKHMAASSRISVEDILTIEAGNGMIDESDSILMLQPIYESVEPDSIMDATEGMENETLNENGHETE